MPNTTTGTVRLTAKGFAAVQRLDGSVHFAKRDRDTFRPATRDGKVYATAACGALVFGLPSDGAIDALAVCPACKRAVVEVLEARSDQPIAFDVYRLEPPHGDRSWRVPSGSPLFDELAPQFQPPREEPMTDPTRRALEHLHDKISNYLADRIVPLDALRDVAGTADKLVDEVAAPARHAQLEADGVARPFEYVAVGEIRNGEQPAAAEFPTRVQVLDWLDRFTRYPGNLPASSPASVALAIEAFKLIQQPATFDQEWTAQSPITEDAILSSLSSVKANDPIPIGFRSASQVRKILSLALVGLRAAKADRSFADLKNAIETARRAEAIA